MGSDTTPKKPPGRRQGQSGAGDASPQCRIAPPDLSAVTVVELHPQPPLTGYRQAVALANAEAGARLEDPMLVSWYDRDRDFESPQHASECHAASAVPGYVDYGLHHGATLKVDVENGRFVFFYTPIDL